MTMLDLMLGNPIKPPMISDVGQSGLDALRRVALGEIREVVFNDEHQKSIIDEDEKTSAMMTKAKKVEGLLNVEDFFSIENILKVQVSIPEKESMAFRVARTTDNEFFVVDDEDRFFPNVAFFGSNTDETFRPVTFSNEDDVRDFLFSSLAQQFQLTDADMTTLSVEVEQIR